MVDKTKSTKNDNNQGDGVVSPTQAQMDEWIKEELAEAEQDNMLSKSDGVNSMFEEELAE